VTATRSSCTQHLASRPSARRRWSSRSCAPSTSKRRRARSSTGSKTKSAGDDEPKSETWEEEELDHGYAPWEVRVTTSSHHEAKALVEQLESEGYRPLRRFQYVIVGTASKEDADRLAARLHGEVEGGGELVYEVEPANPFAIFGGLGL
jgi:hypothetical protein